MKRTERIFKTFILALPLLSGCTFNPMSGDNHLTGSPQGAAVGTAVGVGAVALFRGSTTAMLLGGLTGGAIGYYVTTLRFDSGGVIQGGGQVYTIGDYVGIYIPTDKVFEPNSTDFTPNAVPILDSAVAVLQRYPNSNIIISGNTSGFGRPGWEQKLSQERAQKVASYLWNAGINNFKNQSIDTRKLNYVGYGDFFPIASNLHNDGVRQNSRIQITAYPSTCDLGLDKRRQAVFNMGGLDDSAMNNSPVDHCGPGGC